MKLNKEIVEFLVNNFEDGAYFSKYYGIGFVFYLAKQNGVNIIGVTGGGSPQGIIMQDYSLRPQLDFARELFDIAIDGITKEYEMYKLNKDLAVNNVVKSKTFKI